MGIVLYVVGVLVALGCGYAFRGLLGKELKKLGVELKAEIAKFEADLRAEIAKLKAKV